MILQYDIIQFLDFINYYKMNQQIIQSGDKLLSLPKCNIHYFKLKQKAVLSSGPCQVYLSSTHVHFKSDKTHLELKLKSQLIKFKEINYCTYLYCHENGGINSISIPSADYQTHQQFQNVMKEHMEMPEFLTLPEQSDQKQKILLETPINQPGPELGSNNDDKLEQIGKGIGSVFGGISSLFNTSKINKQSDEAITKFSRDTFSEGTLSGWQRFKNKCSEINNVMSDTIKPVSQKCKQIVSDVGTSFDNSNNSFIKAVREYSKKTQKALNEGYQKSDAPRRASYIPENSSSRGHGEPSDQVMQSNQNKKNSEGLKIQTGSSQQKGSNQQQRKQDKQEKAVKVISFNTQQTNLLEETPKDQTNERKSLL